MMKKYQCFGDVENVFYDPGKATCFVFKWRLYWFIPIITFHWIKNCDFDLFETTEDISVGVKS